MSTQVSHSADAYDIIIVGAGGVGSATAYHLAQTGRRILLLEQFAAGHVRGSSHGGSRIIRYTHDTTDYVRQMPETFAMWRRLEQEAGAHLMEITGGLYAGPATSSFIQNAQQALTELDFPLRILGPADLRRAYPQFRLPDGWIGFYQEHSGILAASRCVETLATQAVRHGAELRENTRVLAVLPDHGAVTVRVAVPGGEETLHAAQIIITAGPWAQSLLEPLLPFSLPLRVTHQQVAYFPVLQEDLYTIGRFGIFILADDPHFYGFPIWERPGTVKIALEQTEMTVDPNGVRTVDPQLLNRLSALVAQYMNGLDPTPVHAEPCLYTETPTRDFIIDRHPENPQILIGAGFSGRGFKHTIAIGRLLADLALSEPGTYRSPFWLDSYRITRFANAAGSNATD